MSAINRFELEINNEGIVFRAFASSVMSVIKQFNKIVSLKNLEESLAHEISHIITEVLYNALFGKSVPFGAENELVTSYIQVILTKGSIAEEMYNSGNPLYSLTLLLHIIKSRLPSHFESWTRLVQNPTESLVNNVVQVPCFSADEKYQLAIELGYLREKVLTMFVD